MNTGNDYLKFELLSLHKKLDHLQLTQRAQRTQSELGAYDPSLSIFQDGTSLSMSSAAAAPSKHLSKVVIDITRKQDHLGRGGAMEHQETLT
jgi:hypothetical protein